MKIICGHFSFSVYNRFQLETLRNENRIILYEKSTSDLSCSGYSIGRMTFSKMLLYVLSVD